MIEVSAVEMVIVNGEGMMVMLVVCPTVRPA